MFADKESFKKAFLEKLETFNCRSIEEASALDVFITLGNMIREYTNKNWVATNRDYKDKSLKQVYYFSMEFLLGSLLGNNLLNLCIRETCEEGLKDLGFNLNEIEALEPDAGLGNGGLGRLAACFLDSLASLGFPGHGCGIRYKYGLFEQKIIDGYQVELPDNWLRDGNVWEVRRPEYAVVVKFGGRVNVQKLNNRLVFELEDYESVRAVPYEVPIIGYKNKTVNTLQLWSAESVNRGSDFFVSSKEGKTFKDYRCSTESISELLYPDDSYYEGRLLRLKQEYFLVSASIQSIALKYKKIHGTLNGFQNEIAIHLNDTHPVLAIPELMRILIDEECMGWEEAWQITVSTISYTNHTTLGEALERWPLEMLKSLLPRIFMIIDEINERFCRELWNTFPGEWGKISNMAIIAYGQVRMAHLACIGSHSVNGVSKIHTEILKNGEMHDFSKIYPFKFRNITNGITHRRWLLNANGLLAKLITDAIGPKWVENPMNLKDLLKYSTDTSFKEADAKVKTQNKIILAKLIKDSCGINVDVNSIFDVQVKRLHLYKRQLLNVFHIMDLYNRLVENPNLDIVPRTFIFGAKSAPGYQLSKKVIKLINTLAYLINNDKQIKDKIKVVFLENYRVTLAEKIIPAADVSEQISTASKEASGTGNMKFMMNGAITLGTLDGANIEIMDEVGDNNIFIFGLSPKEVMSYYEHGGYSPWDIYYSDPRLRKVVDQLINGFFPTGENEFYVIYHSLLYYNDEFFVLKDFPAYADAQDRINSTYQNKDDWITKSITNTACSGNFSSDRTIAEYAKDIWGIIPCN